MNLNGVGLDEFPTRSNVNHRLDDVVAIVVNQRQRTRFIADRQREVIVVDETHFFDLGRVINIVEQNTARALSSFHSTSLESPEERL